MAEVVCYCGTGYDGHLPSHPMHPRGDSRYRLLQREARCDGCRAVMAWWETPAGKRSPHDYDGTSHFATCPKASRFRADKRIAGAEKAALLACPATEEAVRELASQGYVGCHLCGRPADEHTSEEEVPHD